MCKYVFISDTYSDSKNKVYNLYVYIFKEFLH